MRQALEAVEEEDGWSMLGPVGTHIANHASFDQRNFGFLKLSELFSAIDLFEMKKTNGSMYWVEIKNFRNPSNKRINTNYIN